MYPRDRSAFHVNMIIQNKDGLGLETVKAWPHRRKVVWNVVENVVWNAVRKDVWNGERNGEQRKCIFRSKQDRCRFRREASVRCLLFSLLRQRQDGYHNAVIEQMQLRVYCLRSTHRLVSIS